MKSTHYRSIIFFLLAGIASVVQAEGEEQDATLTLDKNALHAYFSVTSNIESNMPTNWTESVTEEEVRYRGSGIIISHFGMSKTRRAGGQFSSTQMSAVDSRGEEFSQRYTDLIDMEVMSFQLYSDAIFNGWYAGLALVLNSHVSYKNPAIKDKNPSLGFHGLGLRFGKLWVFENIPVLQLTHDIFFDVGMQLTSIAEKTTVYDQNILTKNVKEYSDVTSSVALHLTFGMSIPDASP